MKHIIALGFVVALALSGCGGGATSSTPDGNTGGSIEETNARLTAIVKKKIELAEIRAGGWAVDNSIYSSMGYEVKYTVLNNFQGTILSFTITCKYELTEEKFIRMSYLQQSGDLSHTIIGDIYCPESE
jgi:hypothetical protein